MKIDIIGSVASGKTTLAKELSNIYDVRYYEKDNIVWMRTDKGDIKRTDSERDEIFRNILEQDNWIVEGSPRKSLNESFELCDYIILLDINTITRIYRVIRRFIRQRCGKETYNSKPTLSFLLSNIKWVFEYNKIRKDLITRLSKHGSKLKIFRSSKDAKSFISSKYKIKE